MKLTAAELACVRSQGLYITHKCDTCGKPLNQTLYYCLHAGDDQRWCSAACQDEALGWNTGPPEKVAKPAYVMPVCQRCQKRFRAKRRDARYCSARCRQRETRRRQRSQGARDAVVTDKHFSPLPDPHKQRLERGRKNATPPF